MELFDLVIHDLKKCFEEFKLKLIALNKKNYCSSLDTFLTRAIERKSFTEYDLEKLTILSDEIYQEVDLNLESRVYEILVVKYRL